MPQWCMLLRKWRWIQMRIKLEVSSTKTWNLVYFTTRQVSFWNEVTQLESSSGIQWEKINPKQSLLGYHKHTQAYWGSLCDVERAEQCVLYTERSEWSVSLIRPQLWLLLLPPPFASIWAFWPPKKTDTRVKELHLSSSSSLTSSFLVLASSLSLHSIQRTRPRRDHPTESSRSPCFVPHSPSISILVCFFTWEEKSCAHGGSVHADIRVS